MGGTGKVFIGQNTFFVTLHGITDGYTHGNSVHTIMIGNRDQLYGSAHVVYTEVGAIGKQTFVLDSGHSTGKWTCLDNRHLLTSDRALSTSNHLDLVMYVQVFTADHFSVLIDAFLEVACW